MITPLLLPLLVLCPASPAFADWQADLHMSTPARPPRNVPMEMDGKAEGTSSAMRMDIDGPGGAMSIITDWGKKKVWSLMHSRKMYSESDMDRAGVNLPSCKGDDLDTCLVNDGFAKTGSESVNGHPCAVYEKDRAKAGGGKTHTKLWHPTDLKGVPILRSVSSDGTGKKTQVDFTNATNVASLDASLFAPPSDYKSMSMGGAPKAGGMPPGFKIPPNGHMTPEQAAKLREQMLKQYGQPAGQ